MAIMITGYKRNTVLGLITDNDRRAQKGEYEITRLSLKEKSMTERDIIWNIQRINNSMGFRITEDGEDITTQVVDIHMFLTDGLVYSCEMTFEDGSVWTGRFTPLA